MSLTMTIAVNGAIKRTISDIPWTSGMSAQDAMEHAYHTGAGYSFALQYFGKDLGYEVTAIDNILSLSGSDLFLFWEFRVNGEVSPTGIDQTKPGDGTLLGWNYVPYDSQIHDSGRYAAIRSATVTK